MAPQRIQRIPPSEIEYRMSPRPHVAKADYRNDPICCHAQSLLSQSTANWQHLATAEYRRGSICGHGRVGSRSRTPRPYIATTDCRQDPIRAHDRLYVHLDKACGTWACNDGGNGQRPCTESVWTAHEGAVSQLCYECNALHVRR